MPGDGPGKAAELAMAWLVLATAAVAASSLFAILIVMARVPGLGALFPGTEFYRVALTLHVNLSQWVWFMAFAGALWALSLRREPASGHWMALVLAASGAVAMAISPAMGGVTPLMSNYFPVLDNAWFLAGLGTSALAVLIASSLRLSQLPGLRQRLRGNHDDVASVADFGLWLAALVVVVALLVLVLTWWTMPGGLSGLAFFEVLFWGSGHVWQFCLTTMMLLSWLGLSGARVTLPAPTILKRLLFLGVLPAVLSPMLLLTGTGSQGYFSAFTMLMQWASWEVPLFLGFLLLLRHWQAGAVPETGLSLSFGLLLLGVLLGTMISGPNTLVTAHYHGTIGAVTLAFMGSTYLVLGRLGCSEPSRRAINWQLRLYGYGILLMMAGLAGAGLMGAPRKAAGNVAVEFGVESFSRVVLGLGGSFATVGILMFLVLVLRQLWPGAALRRVGHG